MFPGFSNYHGKHSVTTLLFDNDNINIVIEIIGYGMVRLLLFITAGRRMVYFNQVKVLLLFTNEALFLRLGVCSHKYGM